MVSLWKKTIYPLAIVSTTGAGVVYSLLNKEPEKQVVQDKVEDAVAPEAQTFYGGAKFTEHMFCLNQKGPTKAYRTDENISQEDIQKAKECRAKLPVGSDYLSWFEKG